MFVNIPRKIGKESPGKDVYQPLTEVTNRVPASNFPFKTLPPKTQ